MKLEFHEPEETFIQNVTVAEDTIKQQRLQIERKADMKELLRKHKVWHSSYGSISVVYLFSCRYQIEWFFGIKGHVALDWNLRPECNALLLWLIQGDI